jgi:hypothetical protein
MPAWEPRFIPPVKPIALAALPNRAARNSGLSITHISAKQMGCDKLSPYYIKVREKSKC